MKRIDFIAPVEAMRGNLSGKQNLKYALNDNPAYDGPVGEKNYARNYTNRFIGAKRASDGLKYFSVRTKTCNHLTVKAKKAMALMGGVGAIIASILRTKSSAIYTGIYAQWVAIQELGDKRSFRQYLDDHIRPVLAAKGENILFTGPQSPVTVKNPWFDGSQTTGAEVTQVILVKFWGELAPNGIYFTVGGQTGIAKSGMDFSTLIISDNPMNVLGLSTEDIGTGVEDEYPVVKLGDQWLTAAGKAVPDTTVIANGSEYPLQDEQPERPA